MESDVILVVVMVNGKQHQMVKEDFKQWLLSEESRTKLEEEQ